LLKMRDARCSMLEDTQRSLPDWRAHAWFADPGSELFQRGHEDRMMQSTIPQAEQRKIGPWLSACNRLLLYLGFAATGVSVALPGALMPWLLVHWSLQDSQAGVLLFLFFLGNTSGALLSRGRLRVSIVRGSACVTLGAALLPFVSHAAAYAAILLYGLGLGIVMTSISLFQSRRWADDCAAELTRLNLIWAIGACSGPWLVLHDGIRNGMNARHVLIALAAAFAFFGVWLILFEQEPAAPVRLQQAPARWSLFAAPLALLVMVFCSTGVESSCGGWLATYSQRSGHSLGVTIGAPTCFWAGLLVSRVLHSSARIGRASKQFLLTWNLVVLAVAVGTLILARRSETTLIAAFVVGFAAGPMYPLLLSLIYRYDSGNKTYVLAGLGAASLPLMTGLLSTASGSLRAGLAAPFAGAAAMAIAGSVIYRANKGKG
jgi:FHS family glucose/mannose:H+ symporter-like MFS transporter